MADTFHFMKEWPLPHPLNIDWCNANRRKVNAIIQMFNQWQLDGFPAERVQALRAHFAMGDQTLSDDGGYKDDIAEMRAFLDSWEEEQAHAV